VSTEQLSLFESAGVVRKTNGADVLQFPVFPAPFRAKNKLADFLWEIADYIDGMEIETDPHAICLILTGETRNEILPRGYKSTYELCEAIRTANRYASLPSRSGGNIVTRIL
jgi:hypothetical protein